MKNPKQMYRHTGMLLLLLTIAVSPTLADSARPDAMPSFNVESLLDDESVETISLNEVVLQALKHNLDIIVSKQTRDVRVTDILFEQAKFDPTVEISARRTTSFSKYVRKTSRFLLRKRITFDSLYKPLITGCMID